MFVCGSTTTVFAVVDPTSMPSHKQDDAVIQQNIHEKRRLDKECDQIRRLLIIRIMNPMVDAGMVLRETLATLCETWVDPGGVFSLCGKKLPIKRGR
jgi:hypothetical protein